MPPDLKERVKAAAAANNRSLNAEIVALLEEKFPAPVSGPLDLDALDFTSWLDYIEAALTDAEFEARMNEINRRLSAGKVTRRFMVKVFVFEDGTRHLFVTRSGFQDDNIPSRPLISHADLIKRMSSQRPAASSNVDGAIEPIATLHESPDPRFVPIQEVTPRKRDP